MTTASDYALVQGLRTTRATLEGWNRQPWPVLRDWFLGALIVSIGLLFAVYLVAKLLVTPDLTQLSLPGLHHRARIEHVGYVLFQNSLVLALHGFACVAGFIAGSSLPLTAQRHTGIWRWVHEKAGPLAIAFVIAATIFSLMTQAFILGATAADLAAQLDISPGLLLVTFLPHALPELTMLFLPLAAWTIASRRGQWHELLAATFVTVGIAAPVLVVTAFIEVYVSPHLLIAAAG